MQLMGVSLVAVLVFVLSAPLYSQEPATTVSGKAVLLYSDGTWKYATQKSDAFSRPASATERVQLTDGNAVLYFDPAIWSVLSNREQGTHTALNLKHTSAWPTGIAVVVAKRGQSTIAALRDTAVDRVMLAMPDGRIINERYHKVNGLEVFELQIRGTTSIGPLVYLGYYYAGKEGSFEILTAVKADLFDKFLPDLQRVVGGFRWLPEVRE